MDKTIKRAEELTKEGYKIELEFKKEIVCISVYNELYGISVYLGSRLKPTPEQAWTHFESDISDGNIVELIDFCVNKLNSK